MANKKQTPLPRPKRPLWKEEPEVEEFMEIGGSPVPGITLRQVLRGHTGWIGRIAWSPEGRHLASPSEANTTRIRDIKSGECFVILEEPYEYADIRHSP